MSKIWCWIWFIFIFIFAVIKDVFDILGNLAAAFGGNIISVLVDIVCIIMIILLTLLQKGQLKSLFSLQRKYIIKNLSWILDLIPVAIDFLPLTTISVILDQFITLKDIKQNAKEVAQKEKIIENNTNKIKIENENK